MCDQYESMQILPYCAMILSFFSFTNSLYFASLYHISLRRKQIQAVEASMPRLAQRGKDALQSITASGLVAAALASGDVNSVKDFK